MEDEMKGKIINIAQLIGIAIALTGITIFICHLFLKEIILPMNPELEVSPAAIEQAKKMGLLKVGEQE